MNEEQAEKIIKLLTSIDERLEVMVDGSIDVKVINKVEVEGSVTTYDPP